METRKLAALISLSLAITTAGCASDPADEAEAPAAETSSPIRGCRPAGAVVTLHAANMRAAPSAGSGIVRVLGGNTLVQLRGSLCEQNGFFLVTVLDGSGATGWVWGDYLSELVFVTG